MERKKAKLLYSSCDINGHDELPMNRVCVDRECTKRALLCGKCIEAGHKGHQLMPLNEFLSKYENLKSTSSLADPQQLYFFIDQSKREAEKIIKETIQFLVDQLVRLDAVAHFYERMGKGIREIYAKKMDNFVYDSTIDNE